MVKIVIAAIFSIGLFSTFASADQQIIAAFVDVPPAIDGKADDAAWKSSPVVSTRDAIANIPIELQAVYTREHLFLKARFPDATENRKHKLLVWNPTLNIYRTGTTREDSFVIKWSMEPVPTDLSLNSETPYRADIWFWKAFRTDMVGYADDKSHIYSPVAGKKAQKIILPNGHIMFLKRPSDSGKSAYESIAYEKFSGDIVVRYKHRQPTGSRADVRAKGLWLDGYWTVEFQRDLQNGHSDDIQFNTKLPYFFGVSRYEIGGKPPNPKLEQPNYESGDIGETLKLVFQ